MEFQEQIFTSSHVAIKKYWRKRVSTVWRACTNHIKLIKLPLSDTPLADTHFLSVYFASVPLCLLRRRRPTQFSQCKVFAGLGRKRKIATRMLAHPAEMKSHRIVCEISLRARDPGLRYQTYSSQIIGCLLHFASWLVGEEQTKLLLNPLQSHEHRTLEGISFVWWIFVTYFLIYFISNHSALNIFSHKAGVLNVSLTKTVIEKSCCYS
jgi:hypothetical protein